MFQRFESGHSWLEKPLFIFIYFLCAKPARLWVMIMLTLQRLRTMEERMHMNRVWGTQKKKESSIMIGVAAFADSKSPLLNG